MQNPLAYQSYALLRQAVAKRLGRKESDVETEPLWHGTDEDTAGRIASGKFDRGFSGRNGTSSMAHLDPTHN